MCINYLNFSVEIRNQSSEPSNRASGQHPDSSPCAEVQFWSINCQVFICYLPPRRRPGTGDIEMPSVCLSVTFTLLYFSKLCRYIYMHHVMGVCCIGFWYWSDVVLIFYEFLKYWTRYKRCAQCNGQVARYCHFPLVIKKVHITSTLQAIDLLALRGEVIDIHVHTKKDRSRSSIFELSQYTPEIHPWYKFGPNVINICWVTYRVYKQTVDGWPRQSY